MKHLGAGAARAAILILPLLSCAPNVAPERTVVNLPRRGLATLPFSDAILVGRTLYLSGRTGLDLNDRVMRQLGGDWSRVDFAVPTSGEFVDEFESDARAPAAVASCAINTVVCCTIASIRRLMFMPWAL